MKSSGVFAKRLTRKILLWVTLLLTVIVLFIEVYSCFIVANISEKKAESMLQSTIFEIENNLLPAESVATNLSWLAAGCVDNKDNLFKLVEQAVGNNPGICGAAVAFTPGYYPDEYAFSPFACYDTLGCVVSKNLGENHDFFYEDWFQIPFLLNKPVWSEPYYDEAGAKMLMSTYSAPINDADGNIIGIATADVSLDWLSEKLVEMKPFENSQTMLIGKNGSFIAADRFELLAGETIYSLAQRSGSQDIMDIVNKLMEGKKEGLGIEKYTSGRQKSFIVHGTLNNGWVAYTNCWYRDVMAAANQMFFFLTIMGLLALAVLSLVCKSVIAVFTNPVNEFSDAAKQIAAGDFNVSLPDLAPTPAETEKLRQSGDEIQTLRDSFDNMQTNLKRYISDLTQTTALKERMESELNIGRSIQQSMLPMNFPHRENLDLFARVIPAREVGGDLYDFGSKGDDDLLFIVGDVSGKGVPAAMFMSEIATAFRFTSSMGLSMKDKIKRINDGISEFNVSELFVTLFAGKLDLKTGEMIYCNCGHNPGVIVTPDGKASFIQQVPNMAIGVWPGFEYKEERIMLEKGTRMIFYTDGVTEAEAADKSQYGEQRLLEWASHIPADADSQAVNDSLLASVREFTDGNEQNDDITIMTIKI